MPEHVLNLKDTNPPQPYTLRWDDRQFVLLGPAAEPLLNLPTDQGVHRLVLDEFFGKKIALLLDDQKVIAFEPNPDAWQDVLTLVEKQLRADENFRYHVLAERRRSGWLGLGLVAASIFLSLALTLYLINAAEPKGGLWRFAHRWGLKLAFIILIGLAWTGLTLWLSAYRARQLVRRATRDQDWFRP